ncbi:XRE family transcriptional regulator [Amycolatopsis tucumanensis]|uniref:ImmA/IrrE family metallo-endopeptidase n=1 Tax=Amycolatopsis tucumanensis TaxID=401106 RepID=A0ABP7JQ54_9PSEU|nr:XRE family transcriptional regulator [Amycolatopsis tucumanensis]MCF6424953.1 XRE family transcriptional regulator [Amycolatopsis tucumanensis]
MNPRMLVMARESRGMTQKDLAQAAGVPQGTLSKAENGSTELSEDKLQRLADVLRYPRHVLEWTDPVYGFGSSSFYHRKQQTLPQTTLRKIQANVNFLSMRLRRLSSSIDIKAPFSVPCYDEGEYPSATEVARSIRARWMLPMGPIDSVIAMLESAGVYVVRRDLGSPRISAISVWRPGENPMMVLNEGMSADRERFTMCHELGHWVMHSEPPLEEGRAEREADDFAAELLMPAAEIRPQLHGIDLAKAAALKRYWKTAMSALIRRARDLEVITPSRYRSLCVQMSQHGFSRNEPVEVAREEPTVVDAMVRIHLAEHGYSRRELADVVGLRSDEFLGEFPGPAVGGLRRVQ